jgi:2-keto-4-pentenoate hydratase
MAVRDGLLKPLLRGRSVRSGPVTDVHPRLAAATRVQLEQWRAALDAGAGRVGWKVALGIAEVEALVGAAPALGHLTTARLLVPGGEYRGARADRELYAETELAVEVGADGGIAGLAVELEIVDTGRPPDGLEPIVEANVFHRAVAFGPTVAGARAEGSHARMLVNGELRETAAVVADPHATVAAIARLLAAAGEGPEPGERVLAGSACHVPVAPGDAVVAEVDGPGAVAATIAL